MLKITVDIVYCAIVFNDTKHIIGTTAPHRVQQHRKGNKMRFYSISELQLKAMQRAIDELDKVLVNSFTPSQLSVIQSAFLALDTVLDEQETENTLINKTWKHNAPINPSFLGAQRPKNGEDY